VGIELRMESMTAEMHQFSRSAWRELVGVLATVNSSLDPLDVLDAIARSAARIMDAEASSVLTLDRRREKLVFAAASGPVGAELIGQEFDAKLGIAGRAVMQRSVQVVRDVANDPEFFGGFDEQSTFVTRELLAAPMLFRDEVVGVVEVINRRDGEFSDGDVEVLRLFAELAATGVNNARRHQQLKRENAGLRESFATRDSGMIGSSAALNSVQKLCARVAKSNATVLLLGETGTGKELTARHIHSLSDRQERTFIGINCAALAETLLESELFGHEKGAFTGAVARKIGRFELAEGGHCSWMRSGISPPPRRSSCSACCRNASSFGWAAPRRWPATCGSSPRPIATCPRPSRRVAFARTCTTG
jgi:transcriptional regulator with GAF, ATPase, and Fis domain